MHISGSTSSFIDDFGKKRQRHVTFEAWVGDGGENPKVDVPGGEYLAHFG